MLTVNFAEVRALQQEGALSVMDAMLANCARALEAAGADCVLLCANTVHKHAEAVEQAVGIPLLHIVDATAKVAVRAGVERVGLLGTRWTMEEPFWRERARAAAGLQVLVPGEEDRAELDRIIFEQLVHGVLRESSRERLRAVMAQLVERGAEAIVLGCTEFGLLVGQGDAAVPVWDTLRLHAEAAVDWALSAG